MLIDKLGPYRVVRLLGEGGMGLVYEAVHEQIGRRVAIKLMHPALASQGRLAHRFLTEARSANLVRHPGIVEIFDIGQREDGTPYLVMEFLDGESLWARLCRVGTLDEAAVLALAGQIASALRAAHEKGIIHRDLKPDNIMIVKDPLGPGGERVKLLDFGIAKLLFEEDTEDRPGAEARPGPPHGERIIPARGTRAGDSLGTMTYMAPEQHLDPRRVTTAADVFSLGVTLYESLCAKLPFPPFGSLVHEAIPLRDQAPGVEVSQGTADLIAAMLRRNPQARPTLPEIEAALRPPPLVSTPGPGPGPGSAPERAPARTPRLIAGLLAGLLCAGAGAAALSVYRTRQRAPSASRIADLRREALRLLVADLRLPEAPGRRSALAALAHGPDLAPAPDAERLLADPAHEVREQAAETLGRLGDLAVLPALRARLDGDPAPPVRLVVAAALDQLGDGQGIRRLQAALAGPDPDLRLRAALLLAPRGNAAALELLRGLLSQPLPEDAELAVRTRLALSGDGAARAALLRRLDAIEPLSRRLTLAATLARLGEERGLALLRKVAAGPPGAGEQLLATRLLTSLSEPVQAEALRQVLRQPERAAAARLLAAEALGECGEQADAELLAPLALSRSADLALRHAAAAALLRLGAVLGQGAGPAMDQGLRWAQQALLSDQPALREAAVALLADAASGEAVPLLAARLEKDPSPAVRREAARALSRHPGAQALAPLDAALADPDEEVRGEALRALGAVGAALRERGQGRSTPAEERAEARTRDHVEASRRALGDEDWQVRFRAARALAGRDDPGAAPVLREALRRQDPAQALLAYALLRRLGERPEAVPRADLAGRFRAADGEVRAAVLADAERLPAGEALLLVQLGADDPLASVRRQAGEAALRLAGIPSLFAQARLLLRRLAVDPDPSVRLRALGLLSRLGQGPAEKAPPPDLAVREEAAAGPGTGDDPPGKDEDTGQEADPPRPETGGLPKDGREVSPAQQARQHLSEGEAALVRGDLARAQRLLLRGIAACQRGGCGAASSQLSFQLSFALGRTYQAQERWVEAMNEFARARERGRPRGGDAARLRKAEAAAASHVGTLRVRKIERGRCRPSQLFMVPGEHQIQVGGVLRTVRVRAGAAADLDLCQEGE